MLILKLIPLMLALKGSTNTKNSCLIINELELRHELRDSSSSLDVLAKKIWITVKYKKLVITCGSLGAVIFSSNGKKKVHCPAFAGKIVDKLAQVMLCFQ